MKIKLILVFTMFVLLLNAQSFVEKADIPFDSVGFSTVIFEDVDKNGFPDLLITGVDCQYKAVTKLYMNEGGNFEEDLDAPFVSLGGGDAIFGDVDGDDDADLLISGNSLNTGTKDAYRHLTHLYLNDGGQFTLAENTTFYGVEGSSMEFADVDSDGDLDVLISGQRDVISNERGAITALYLNENGNFSLVENAPFEHISFGSVVFDDIDEDGDPDLLMNGYTNNLDSSNAKLYKNESGDFTEVVGMPFKDGGLHNTMDLADIDSDGDLDLLITGVHKQSVFASLYENQGGQFLELSNTPFEGVGGGDTVFADFDRDGDLDIILSGGTLTSRICKLYINEGGGRFSEFLDTPFEGFVYGAIAVADIDGDGDQDVLLSGFGEFEQPITKLYINQSIAPFNKELGFKKVDSSRCPIMR